MTFIKLTHSTGSIYLNLDNVYSIEEIGSPGTDLIISSSGTSVTYSFATPTELDEALAKLKSILTYHVLEGKMLSEDLANLTSAKTIQGQDIDIDTKDGVKINKAKVTNPNILASNGVIHIIDTVILPK